MLKDHAKLSIPHTSLQRAFESRPTLCILVAAILIRVLTATWPYSGYQSPPTHGDFEAQRHWMEITTQLPVIQWYFHNPNYWRLDYPPLTAYHSWICGQIGRLFDPRWFALDSSWGLETLGLKVFMRASVIVSECMIFIPAVIFCTRRLSKRGGIKSDTQTSLLALAALLMQPALVMIDHGHFQYNTVMLGFVMTAATCLLAGRDLMACVFFVAALGFKQMALFYAPPIAAYLAGGCLTPQFMPLRLATITAVTLLSFGLVYGPLLLGTWYDISNGVRMSSSSLLDAVPGMPESLHPYIAQILQTLQRMFPLSRGIFEDKVANIWCAVNHSGLYKLKSLHTSAELAQAAMGMTLLSILSPCLITFLRPRKELVLHVFATCAWGFFLCGFHVHEKSVLLPLVPMTAMLAGPDGKSATTRAWVGFANVVGAWTLFHLMIKDNLRLAYLFVFGTWIILLGRPLLWEPYRSQNREAPSGLVKFLHLSAYGGILVWHILEYLVPAPAGKPDLWIVASMILGCGAFCMCYVWCLWRLFQKSGLAKDMRTLRLLFDSFEKFISQSIE